VSSKGVVGYRVKRSARDALHPLVPPRGTNPADNFTSRTAREGQQENSFGGDLALEQELHSGAQRGGFAGPWSRQYAKGTVAKGGGLALAIVQVLLRCRHGWTLPSACHTPPSIPGNNPTTTNDRAARVIKERVRARQVIFGVMGLALVAVVSPLAAGASPTVRVHVVSTAKTAGGPAITTVACMSVGHCVLAGYGTNDHVFVRAERGGHWGRNFDPMKDFRTAVAPSLDALSCYRSGCLGFGEFTSSRTSQRESYFTVSYSGGTWHPAKTTSLALGSAKGFDASGMSCRDSRDCVVVGRLPYSDNSVNYADFVSAPGILTMTKGQWDSPTLMGAKFTGFPSQFADVSCPSWGNCVAVGVGKVGDGHFESIEARETDGTWSSVMAPFSQTWEVLSVSCPTIPHCTVGGRIDSLKGTEAFVSSEQSGRWVHAVPVGAAWTVKKGYTMSDANLLSCSSATTCVVGGMVDGPRPTLSRTVSVSSVAWVANETAGEWDEGALIGYRSDKDNQGQLSALSCPSPTWCTAVGQSEVKNSKLEQVGLSDNFVATVTP
jgi:hypothetical protein